MTASVAQAMMAVAVRCLGAERRDWALAMRAEFGAAAEDGREFGFALGCLVAAARELPTHVEGRFTIAGYALALGLIVPVAAILVTVLVADFPLSYLGPAIWLNEGNRSAVPTLALLTASLAALRLRVAWLVLDRDWARVGATMRLIAAATIALLMVAGLVFDAPGPALTQAAISAAELALVAALARRSSFAGKQAA